MKKLVVGAALILSTGAVQAQEPAAAAPATPAVNALFSPTRIVKTNLVGYASLTVTANYEQKTGPKTSVGLLGGYTFPGVKTVEAIGELDGENQEYTGEVTPEGYFLNPYFRFYTGKAMTGFYMEAFLRYYDYTYLVPYEYTKDGNIINANMDGSASGFGGGLALGGQFKLFPRVYLDINGGLGLANGDAHVETNDPNLDADDYQTIKRNIEENAEDADIKIDVLDRTINSLVAGANETSAWADIENEIFVIMRGGISIGFAF